MNSNIELLTYNMEKTNNLNEQIENDLKAKILKITMRIKDYYPELSQPD